MVQPHPPPTSYLGGQNSIPPIGYPVAPITVSAGVIATIPAPVQQGGPVPEPIHWCVILNSSPFTLLVTQGGNLQQIAAFTADLVELLMIDGRTGITLLPQAGVGTATPGSDSTVYATYYGPQRPAGSFPAALGSGSVSLNTTSILYNTPNFFPPETLPHPAGHRVIGPFATAGFGSVHLGMITANAGIIGVRVRFYPDSLGSMQTGIRQFYVGGSTTNLFVTVPVLDAFFDIELTNVSTVDMNYTLLVDTGVQSLSQWSGLDQYDFSGSIAGAGGTSVTFPTFVFNGQATFMFQSFATVWTMEIAAQQPSGSFQRMLQFGNGATLGQAGSFPLVIPAVPLAITLTNSDAGAKTMLFSMQYQL